MASLCAHFDMSTLIDDKKYENLTHEKLRQEILFVLEYLYSSEVDGVLIVNGANERCLAARFFAYMMNHTSSDPDYQGLVWDPEYNRHGDDPKRLYGTEIIPDLILHHRGDDRSNILAIEFKKTGLSSVKDVRKLRGLTGREYNYRLGVHIVLSIEKVTLEWFRKGRSFAVETYAADTWLRLS